MVLKIVTGQFKGKTLASSDSAKELRPTQAVVREAIINTLKSAFLKEEFLPYEDFCNLKVLDLFSGTGSMGFEFLSNGVNSIDFIDYDPKCLKLLKSNTDKLLQIDKVTIHKGKIPVSLKNIARKKSSFFDLVFFDPPFKVSTEDYLGVVQEILKNNLLKPSAILILEYKNNDLKLALEKDFSDFLEVKKTKVYGDCVILFAQKFSEN